MLCLATFAAFELASPAGAGVTRDTEFRSAAIGGDLHFEIYLPPDYEASTRRYPVIYFLHGLPAGGGDYRTIGFVQRALDRANHQAILVVPQGARDGDADPEYLDRGPGERWETAIAHELPRVVDARFRTIASRAGRALVGVSAGGYGAMHLALEHLPDFSVVESWSGYFHPTDPTGTRALNLGSSAKNAAANVHRQARVVRAQLRRLPTLIAFYVGTGDLRFEAENELLNQQLSRAGVAHIFRLYAGGHSQSLWGRYAPAWLALALAHMAPPR